MEKPLISIIIPAFNSEKTIKRCLDSIQLQTLPRKNFEIIVVDDGSTDNTVRIAKEFGVEKTIVSKHVSGPNARNLGAKQAKGDLLAFLDSDCEAKPNWLEVIKKELKNSNAIAGSILNGNNNLISWSEYLLEFSDFDPNLKRSFRKFAAASNNAYEKNIFLNVGGFEPKISYSEDVLLGKALKKTGNMITFVPAMQVYHYGRTTLKPFLQNMERFGIRCYNDCRVDENTYTKLTKKKWNIPLVFIFKFGARLKRAYHSKKLSLFLLCLPIILLGDVYFCKGVFKGFSFESQFDKKIIR